MGEPVPALLTVEEAARLLRVGRTKAYAMTQEWRATGGRSGLPVVDFGNVLRVPRQALEALIGASLADAGAQLAVPAPVAPNRADQGGEHAAARDDTAGRAPEAPPTSVATRPTGPAPATSLRRRRSTASQAVLFEA